MSKMYLTPTKFYHSTRHHYHFEIVLEFGSALSGVEAKEVARRIVESIQVSLPESQELQDLQSCRLLFPELGQLLSVDLPSRSDPPTA
jgi:hypothetical protein